MAGEQLYPPLVSGCDKPLNENGPLLTSGVDLAVYPDASSPFLASAPQYQDDESVWTVVGTSLRCGSSRQR